VSTLCWPERRLANCHTTTRGAVPGSKGGWVMVRDAVKKPHKDSPMPGSVKKRDAKAAPAAEQKAEG